MKKLSLFVCSLALAACTPPSSSGQEVEIQMTADTAGNLSYCATDTDGDGQGDADCQGFGNPGSCHVLTVVIDTATGEACETCIDANGNVISESCSGSSVVCSIFTASEPDCVVCSHDEGPVVYTSCIPETPDCQVVHLDSIGTTCEECRDSAGNVTSTTCGQSCSNVVCPGEPCAPGYVAQMPPDGCCPVCVPAPNCTAEVCALEAGLVQCPDGTTMVQDPGDCCTYRCEPINCLDVMCPAIDQACPAGYHLDTTYPNCCGTCVPDENPTELCLSDADCAATEYCTAGGEECLSNCAPGMECPAVCYGTCRPTDVICPQWISPAPGGCEGGEWRGGGRDENGCDLPPTCVCPDGVISADGTCPDSCANVACFAPPPVCGPNERLVTDYPYCCGICEPIVDCTTVLCAMPDCAYGYTTETQPGECCPTCVPDPNAGCYSSAECGVGQVCSTELGICGAPPECDPNQMCTTACYGTCVERSVCAANSDCLAGQLCLEGRCVSQPACTSDAECGPGLYCETTECLQDPSCDTASGNGCVPTCYGYCAEEPVSPTGCQSNADCPPGEECVTSTAGGINGGTCQAPSPTPTGCQSSSDCAAGEECVFDTASNAGTCQAATNPPANECTASSDCASGEACVEATWCPDCVDQGCMAPCYSYRACEPLSNGEQCGDVVCGIGQVCCNPVMSICTAPGMLCIQ